MWEHHTGRLCYVFLLEHCGRYLGILQRSNGLTVSCATSTRFFCVGHTSLLTSLSNNIVTDAVYDSTWWCALVAAQLLHVCTSRARSVAVRLISEDSIPRLVVEVCLRAVHCLVCRSRHFCNCAVLRHHYSKCCGMWRGTPYGFLKLTWCADS